MINEKTFRRYADIFLSMAIDQLEEDKQHFENAPLKINEPYVELLDKMLTTAKSERRKLNKLMQQKDMKVIKTDETRMFTAYEFISAGKREEARYFKTVIRKHTKKIIEELMKE